MVYEGLFYGLASVEYYFTHYTNWLYESKQFFFSIKVSIFIIFLIHIRFYLIKMNASHTEFIESYVD